MARRMSASELKSKLRQIENQRRQAINKINQGIRRHNAAVRQAVNKYNDAVSRYNSAVRQHNANVRRNRTIIQNELRKLNSQTTHVTYTVSMRTMQQHYTQVGNVYYEGAPVTPEQERILDLVEQEQANGLVTESILYGNTTPVENTEDMEIGNRLAAVSPDLNSRWQGAVYALNPANPDATRHFCTSAREIFTEFIELKAPDRAVIADDPQCELTPTNKTPTRKAKIKYMMRMKGLDESVIAFADADIGNILELFSTLSGGTHGPAGKYSFEKLRQVKKRVEQGIIFLCEIAS